MKKIFQTAVLVFLVFGSITPMYVQAQQIGGPTYGQTIFANTPTYSGVASNPIINTSSNNGACSTLTQRGLGGVVDCVISLMGKIMVVLMAGAVVYIVWGAFQMISSEEKRKSGRDTIVYGIIGLFVMVSIWGLVNILSSTFNLKGSYIPAPQLTP